MELLDGRVGEKSLVVSLDLLIESGSKPRMEILEETRTLPKLEADCLEMLVEVSIGGHKLNPARFRENSSPCQAQPIPFQRPRYAGH